MEEDLERYLDKIVEPTIEEFRKNKSSVRHAFLACVATFHAIDYLAYDGDLDRPRKGMVGNLRKSFESESPDFKLIDDIAHAFKHVAAGSGSNPRLRAHDVAPRHAGTFGHFMFGEHVFNDAGEWVTLKHNRKVRLLEVIERAALFLRQKT